MLYTKQELIDAYCASTGCQEGDLPQIKTDLQAKLDADLAKYQAKLDALPTEAKDEMKRVALAYIDAQRIYQDWLDNADADL